MKYFGLCSSSFEVRLEVKKNVRMILLSHVCWICCLSPHHTQSPCVCERVYVFVLRCACMRMLCLYKREWIVYAVYKQCGKRQPYVQQPNKYMIYVHTYAVLMSITKYLNVECLLLFGRLFHLFLNCGIEC